MIINLFQNKTRSSARHEFSATTMANNSNYKQVKINLTGVFASIKTVDELKYVAQSLVNQVSDAFKVRKSQLTPSTEGEKSAEVVSIEATAPAKTETTKAQTKGTKTTKAPTKPAAKTESKKAETKKSDKEEVKQVLISNLTKEDIKRMGIRFELYSEKCISLTGETKSIKEQIKKLAGGHWNHTRQCWFLKKDNGAKLAKMMGQKVYKKAE